MCRPSRVKLYLLVFIKADVHVWQLQIENGTSKQFFHISWPTSTQHYLTRMNNSYISLSLSSIIGSIYLSSIICHNLSVVLAFRALDKIPRNNFHFMVKTQIRILFDAFSGSQIRCQIRYISHRSLAQCQTILTTFRSTLIMKEILTTVKNTNIRDRLWLKFIFKNWIFHSLKIDHSCNVSW